MTPKQEAEYLQDMESFRVEFIASLSRELASMFPNAQPVLVQAYAELLDKRLPGALECMYPQIEQDHNSRR